MRHRKVEGVGLVQRQRRNTTGTVTTLTRTRLGIPGKVMAEFRIVCLDHGKGKTAHGWNDGQYQAAHPEIWCPGCRQALGLTTTAEEDYERNRPKPTGNVGLCWGCGCKSHGLVVLRHVDDSSLDAPLCPVCFEPGSAARNRWRQRAKAAMEATAAQWQGLSKKARQQKLKQMANGHANMRPRRGRPPKNAEVPILEEDIA